MFTAFNREDWNLKGEHNDAMRSVKCNYDCSGV